MKLTVMVAPQKFNRSPNALRWSIMAQIRMHKPDLIGLTEIGIGNPKRAKALENIPGYSLIHFPGLGRSECGLLYKEEPNLAFFEDICHRLPNTEYEVPGNRKRAPVHMVGGAFHFGNPEKYLTVMMSHWPNTEGDARFKGPQDRIRAWKNTSHGARGFWWDEDAPFFIDLADYNCRFDVPNEMREYVDHDFLTAGLRRKTANQVHGVASGYFKGFKVNKVRMIRQGNKKASDHPYVLWELETYDH